MMMPPIAANSTIAAATIAMIITGLFLRGAPGAAGATPPGP
jgi:hypothetical protein